MSETKVETSVGLAATWTHAHYLASTIHANTEEIDDASKYFRSLNQQSLGAAIARDDSIELDVSAPDLLSASVLLYYGFDYVHKQNAQVFTRPLLRELGEKLKFVDTPESPLSPRLLQKRDAGFNCLDGFLSSVTVSFSSAFNTANPERALDPKWYADRQFEIRKGVLPDLSNSVTWMEVLAHEQRWLEEKIRSNLVAGVSDVDWSRLASESVDMSICTLLVIADMISYTPDEARAASLLRGLLVRCNTVSPISANDLGGTLDNKERHLSQMYSEAVYRSARSKDASRSCRMLAAGFSTIVDLGGDDLSSDFADLLGACIPMLPVEHVQPLVNLRIRLLSRPGAA